MVSYIGEEFVYLRWKGCDGVAAEETIMNNNMTQDERWMVRYNEVMAFIKSNHRNPSRHRIEEHDMLNWMKANRKRMNAGDMKESRLSIFKEMLELCELYKRKNQYE